MKFYDFYESLVRECCPELTDFDSKQYAYGDEQHKPLNVRYHKMLVGKALNLANRVRDNGGTRSEVIRSLYYFFITYQALKEDLDYKRARVDFGIAELEKKYPIRKD